MCSVGHTLAVVIARVLGCSDWCDCHTVGHLLAPSAFLLLSYFLGTSSNSFLQLAAVVSSKKSR